MSYASRSGRARTSAKSPRAFAVCARCGLWYNRDELVFQNEWRGTALVNIWVLVCKRTCLDVPQEQLRAIQLPADPTPVYFPSVEPFQADETPPTNGQPYGRPIGLDQNAVMPFNGAIQKQFGVNLSPLSVTANGSQTISVTCSASHGLGCNDQIAVQGLSNKGACGFFTVLVTSAMAFTYQTYSNIPAGGLLTPTTRMITALVGLPYGYQQIPQVAP